MALAKIKRFFFGPGPKVARELAMRIFKRDHFKCQYCGLDARRSFEHWMIMTIDHVHPYARGGSRHLENLVTACQPCNLIKGKRPFASFEDARKYVVAKREEYRRRYAEQMHELTTAA
jgi:5-methylcytosine-specific restriction endonuclease McrA